jgi:hypothetical protein
MASTKVDACSHLQRPQGHGFGKHGRNEKDDWGPRARVGSKGSKKPPQKGIKEKQLIQEDEEGGIGQVAGSTSVTGARRCRP